VADQTYVVYGSYVPGAVKAVTPADIGLEPALASAKAVNLPAPVPSLQRSETRGLPTQCMG
jgi:hypothetical protein